MNLSIFCQFFVLLAQNLSLSTLQHIVNCKLFLVPPDFRYTVKCMAWELKKKKKRTLKDILKTYPKIQIWETYTQLYAIFKEYEVCKGRL